MYLSRWQSGRRGVARQSGQIDCKVLAKLLPVLAGDLRHSARLPGTIHLNNFQINMLPFEY